MATSELTELALHALRKGGPNGNAYHFDPEAFEGLRQRLTQVKDAPEFPRYVHELGNLAAYLLRNRSEYAGQQLVLLLESFAVPFMKKKDAREVDTAEQKLTEFGQRFESFLGPQGERLPDTGERLDIKALKGPVRG